VTPDRSDSSTPAACADTSLTYIIGEVSGVHFIETPTFRRICDDLLSLEEFRALQLALYDNPDVGDVIPGAAGLRKIRVARAAHGKRGGARAYYYWHVPGRTVWLLYLHAKNVAPPTKEQERELGRRARALIKELSS
jgi:hypothetical protein